MPENKPIVVYKGVDQETLKSFEKAYSRTQDYTELASIFPQLADERGVQAAVEFLNTKKTTTNEKELFNKFPEFPNLKKKTDFGGGSPMPTSKLPGDEIKTEKVDDTKVEIQKVDKVTPDSFWPQQIEDVVLPDPVKPMFKLPENKAVSTEVKQTIFNTPIKGVLNKTLPTNDEQRLQLYEKAINNLGLRAKSKESELNLIQKDIEQAQAQIGAAQTVVKQQMDSKYKPVIDNVQKLYSSGKMPKEAADAEIQKITDAYNKESKELFSEKTGGLQKEFDNKNAILKQKVEEYEKIRSSYDGIMKGVDATFLKRKIIAEGDNYLTDLKNVLNAGSSSVISSFMKTPAAAYDFSRAVTNKLLPQSMQITTKGSEMFPNLEKTANEWEEYGAMLAENSRIKYQGTIEESYDKGNYLEAAAKTGLQIAESAPITLQIGMMMYNPGSGMQVAGILDKAANTKRLWNVFQFGGMKAKEMQKEFNLTDDQAGLLAVPLGITEQFFEETGTLAMTGQLGRIIKQTLKTQGKEQATEVAKKGFRSAFEKAFEKYYPVLGPLYEGVSEAETQFADNAMMKYSGAAPDINLSAGVFDSFVTGTGTGVVMTTPVKVIETMAQLMNRKRLKSIEMKKAQLNEVLNNPASLDASKDFAVDQIGKENETINEVVGSTRDVLQELSKEEIDEVKPVIDETVKLEEVINDPSAPEPLKTQAEAKIEENLNILDSWLSGVQENKAKIIEENALNEQKSENKQVENTLLEQKGENKVETTQKPGSVGVDLLSTLPSSKDNINNAPVMISDPNNKFGGTKTRYIPFSIIEKANKNDKLGGQTAREIAQRGGYSDRELDKLYPNWRDDIKETPQAESKEQVRAEGSVGKNGPVDITAKALEDFKNKVGVTSDIFQELANFAPDNSFGVENGKNTGKKITDVIAELYHADKASGKETALTKAVEQSLNETSKGEAKEQNVPLIDEVNNTEVVEQQDQKRSEKVEESVLTREQVKNKLQEIEKEPVKINITQDESGKMEQTSQEVIENIKKELDKTGLPYSDVVSNEKGSTYFVVTKDGQQHEILKVLQSGGKLVPTNLTKAKWINHLIKNEKDLVVKSVEELLSKEQPQVETEKPVLAESTPSENKDALKDVESTAKALENIEKGLSDRKAILTVSVSGEDASIGDVTKIGIGNDTKIKLTENEKKEVKRQFKLNNDGDLTAAEFNQWRKEFSDKVLNRVKNEINNGNLESLLSKEQTTEVKEQAVDAEKTDKKPIIAKSTPSESKETELEETEIAKPGEVKGITVIEYEDDGDTILFGNKQNKTRVSVRTAKGRMSDAEIQAEIDSELNLLERSKKDVENWPNDLRVMQNSKTSSREDIEIATKMHNGTVRNIEHTEKIIIPFYKSRLKNTEDETNTGTEERSTGAIIAEGEAIRNEAEASESPEKIRTALQKLEEHINSIDAKVVKLTTTWDESELPVDEIAGRQAGKAAKKEVRMYAGQLGKLLGWKAKELNDNIPPAGGDVTFRLEIPDTPFEVWVAVKYQPSYGNRGYENYKMVEIFYRVENPSEKGQKRYVGPNRYMFFDKPQFGLKQEGSVPTPKEFATILAKEAAPYIDKLEVPAKSEESKTPNEIIEGIIKETGAPRDNIIIGRLPTQQELEEKRTGQTTLIGGKKVEEPGLSKDELERVKNSLILGLKYDINLNGGVMSWTLESVDFEEQEAIFSRPDSTYTSGKKRAGMSFKGILEQLDAKKEVQNKWTRSKIDFTEEAIRRALESNKFININVSLKNNDIQNAEIGAENLAKDVYNELIGDMIQETNPKTREFGNDKSFVPAITKGILTGAGYKPKPTVPVSKEQAPEPESKVVEDDDKKAEIKAGIAEKMARLRKLTGGGLSSGVNLEALSLAIEITEDYAKLGYLKFKEIIKGIYEDYGVDTLRDVYPAMKKAYGSYVFSQSTTVGYSTTEDVQQFDLEKFIKDEQQNGKGTDISDGGTSSTTFGRDAGIQEEDAQRNDVGGSERMDGGNTIEVRPDVSGITSNPNAPTTGEPGSGPGNLRPEVNDSTIQHNFAYPADFVRNKNKSFNTNQAYNDNIAALEALVEIMQQGNLYANEEQMTVLSKYNGLGPLGEILLGDDESEWKESSKQYYDQSRRLRELIEMVGSLSKRRIILGDPEFSQGDKVKFDEFVLTVGKKDKIIPAGEGTIVSASKISDGYEYTVSYSYLDENDKPASGNFKFLERDLRHSGSGAQSTAERSTQYAYYTDLPIIRAMWSGIKAANFNHGRVLEGSVGSGRFIGGMPSSLRSTTQVTGVDMDVVSSLVAKYLYPKSKIVNQKLQNANISPNSYDLFVSNIPFSTAKVYDAGLYKKGGLWAESLKTLHGYYVAKALDSVRPGGLISIVTTSGVLDSPSNQSVRDLMHKEAEFIGAVRLPASTFNADAGTQVVTDIIMMRKRQPSEAVTGEPDFLKPVMAKFPTHSSVKGASEMDITFNQYFVNNPQNVFGDVKAGKSMYTSSGVDDYTIEGTVPSEQEIEQALSEMAKDFPIKPWDSSKDVNKTLQLTELGRVVGGGIIAKNGKFYRVVSFDPDTKKTEVEEMKPPAKADIGILESYIKARNLYFEILGNDAKDINSDTQREALRTELANFLKLISPSSIQSIGKGARAISKILTSDPDFYSISALIKNDGSFADVVFTSLKKEPEMISTKDPAEAVMFSINTSGNINAQLISKVMGIPENEVGPALKGYAFETIDGELIYAPLYLSGYVAGKIEQAKEWAQVDAKFQYNVDELEKVKPQDYEIEDIGLELGQAWIPMPIINDFMDALFGKDQVKITYNPTSETWDIDSDIQTGAYIAVAEQYGIEWTSGLADVLDVAFNKKVSPITRTIGSGQDAQKVKLTNLQEAIYEKASDIQEQFVSYCKTNREVADRLKKDFNTINSIVLAVFNGQALTFPGMQGYDLLPHQKDAIMAMIMNYGGMIDHEVGLGKTLVMCVGAIKMKQMGIVNRPVISTMKSVVPGMIEQVKRQYPTAKILAPTEKDFNPQNRQRLFAQITNNDWDLIILTHDNMGKIPLPPDFEREFINNELDELDDALSELSNDPAGKRQRKAIEKRKENLEAALSKLLDVKNASLINFGEMGIDFLMIDESQQFKNLPFITKLNDVKGLGTAKGSERAGRLKMMARYLQQLHGGDKGVLFSSGTPISNSIVEVYNIFSYLRPTLLKRLAINSLDQFVTNFAKVEMVPSVNVAGVIKITQRLNQFINTKPLSNYYREISDVRNATNTYIERPEIKDGKPKLVMVAPDDRSTQILDAIYQASEKVSLEPLLAAGIPMKQGENMESALGLLLTGLGKKLAIDYRMIFPAASPPKSSKIMAMTDNLERIYRETNEDKGVQLVFSDLGTPKKKSATLGQRIQAVLEDKFDSETLAEMPGLEDVYKLKTGEEYEKQAIISLQSAMDISEEEAEEIVMEANDFTTFNVYQEVKDQLINKGIPADEIAFVHDADSEVKKEIMFKKTQNGEIRVLLGSTGKLGTGVNVQTRIAALHHLEMGWRPSDFEQRNGRGIRRGNIFKEVAIFIYGMEGSMDAFIMNIVGKKQSQIDDFRNGTISNVMGNVEGEAMSHLEMASALSGDNRLMDIESLKREARTIRNRINAVNMSNRKREEDINFLQRRSDNNPTEVQEWNDIIAKLGIEEKEVLDPVFKDGVQQFLKDGAPKLEKKTVLGFNAFLNYNNYDTSKPDERSAFYKELSKKIKSLMAQVAANKGRQIDSYLRIGDQTITINAFSSLARLKIEDTNYEILQTSKGDPIELRSMFTRKLKPEALQSVLEKLKDEGSFYKNKLEAALKVPVLEMPQGLDQRIKEIEQEQAMIKASIEADSKRTGTKAEKIKAATAEFVNSALQDVFSKTDVFKQVLMIPVSEWGDEITNNGTDLVDGEGQIYGAYFNGTIYLNPDKISPERPLHEYGHAFALLLKERAPEVFNRGLELVETEGQEYIDAVSSDPRYQDLSKKDLLEEALMRVLADNGAKAAAGKGLVFKNWLKEFWNAIKDFLGLADVTAEQLQKMTLKDFTDSMVRTMFDPEQITKLMEREAKKEPTMRAAKFSAGVNPNQFGLENDMWLEAINHLKESFAKGMTPKEAIDSTINFIDAKGLKWNRKGFQEQLASAYKIPLWARDTKMRKSAKRVINELPFSEESVRSLTNRATYYTQISNTVSANEALGIIKDLGLEQAMRDTLDFDNVPMSNRIRSSLGIALIGELGRLGRYAEQSMVMEKMFEFGTDVGQASSVYQLLGTMGVDGLMYKAVRDNQKMVENWITKNQATIDKLNDQMKGINREVAQQLIEDLAKKYGLVTAQPQKPTSSYGESNKVVSKSLYEQAKAALRGKFFSVGAAIPPELITMAAYHVEASGREFAKFVESIVADTGPKILPMVRKLYELGRNEVIKSGVEASGFLTDLELSQDEVSNIIQTINDQFITNTSNRTIEEDLLANGLDPEASKKAMDIIKNHLKNTAQEKKKALVEKYKGIKDVSAMVDITNRPYNDRQFSKAFAKAFGKELTPDQISQIRLLATKVELAISDAAKFRAIQELMNYQENLQGTDWSEVVLNMWYASILSGPTTQEVNFGQTLINSMMEALTQAIMNPKGGKLFARALWNGLSLGIPEAKDVWVSGVTPVRGKLETSTVLERTIFKGGNMNPFNWAKYVRRLMVASDVIFFEGLKEMRMAQYAYRIAMEEGKNYPTYDNMARAMEIMNYRSQDLALARAEALDIKVRSIEKIKNSGLLESEKRALIAQEESDYLRNFTEVLNRKRGLNQAGDIVTMATKAAARGTYNNKPEGVLGLVASTINGLKRKVASNAENAKGYQKAVWSTTEFIVNFVVPFTNVIANVFNSTIEYSPLGYAKAFNPSGESKVERDVTRNEAIIKATIGTAAMVSLFLLTNAGDDDDEDAIRVTANGTGDYKKNYVLKETGWQPYSVKIGGRWISYQYSPFFLPLMLVGNMNDYIKYRDSKKMDASIQNRLAWSMGKAMPQMFQSTFLQGLTDFTDYMMSDKNDLVEDALKFGPKQLAGFIPNLYKQGFNEIQEAFDIPEKDPRGFAGVLMQEIPVARNMLFDKVNVLGEQIVPDNDKFSSKIEQSPLFDLLVDKKAFLVSANKSTASITYQDANKEVQERPMTNEEVYLYNKNRGDAMKQFLDKNYYELDAMPQPEAKKIIMDAWESFGRQQKQIIQNYAGIKK
jgi:N12 class adenine-specific DNA methylase